MWHFCFSPAGRHLLLRDLHDSRSINSDFYNVFFFCVLPCVIAFSKTSICVRVRTPAGMASTDRTVSFLFSPDRPTRKHSYFFRKEVVQSLCLSMCLCVCVCQQWVIGSVQSSETCPRGLWVFSRVNSHQVQHERVQQQLHTLTHVYTHKSFFSIPDTHAHMAIFLCLYVCVCVCISLSRCINHPGIDSAVCQKPVKANTHTHTLTLDCPSMCC